MISAAPNSRAGGRSPLLISGTGSGSAELPAYKYYKMCLDMNWIYKGSGATDSGKVNLSRSLRGCVGCCRKSGSSRASRTRFRFLAEMSPSCVGLPVVSRVLIYSYFFTHVSALYLKRLQRVYE